MKEDERLREALLEIELLRQREADRARESHAILSALEAMTQTHDASEGIAALLASIQGALGCGSVVLFDVEAEALIPRFPEDAAKGATPWRAPGLVAKARRVVDVQTAKGLWENLPAVVQPWRSLLSIPLTEGQERMVIVAFGAEKAAFSRADADLLRRLATIASQAIIQRTLEQQSSFLAAVIDASPVSVAIADVRDDMPLIYVNNAFTTLTGYRPDEVIGRNCRLLNAEPQDADVRVAIRETLAKREHGTFLLRNRRKSGERFWNELQLFPIAEAQGPTTQIVATQSDVTDRVNAEMARDSARQRLESALSATSEAFMIVGKTGHIRFVNAVFGKIFGTDGFAVSDMLTQEALATLFQGHGETRHLPPLEALQRPIDCQIGLPTGRHVLLRARPMEVGGAVIAATDITQTKVNERILRQRLAAIEISQDGIAIGDTDGRILHTNPSLLSLWGLSENDPGIGRRWTSFYQPATKESFEAAAKSFDATGVWRDEVIRPDPDGSRVHDVSISRVPDVGTVLIVRDVTDRQQEDEERNRLRRQLDLAQMQEQLGQISAGLAHDFNNLLSAILGSATLIAGLRDMPEPAIKAAERIKTAAERAAELVDGFLDLGLRERQSERLSLGDALLTTVDLAQVGAPADITLRSAIPDTPIWVHASRTDLLQTIMNLVVNGLDAMEGQPGEICVTLGTPIQPDPKMTFDVGRLADGQSYAPITVSDTGSGMSDEVRNKVLEPYFTTKGNAGTGLGLAIVVSTLQANGCLMTLESTLGVGTTFTIYWPIETTEEVRPSEPVARKDRRGLPLLIVDDQEDVASALGAALSAAGFEVAETTDPEAAIETILEDRDGWGCVISDYDMPHVNGGELVARLRREAPEVPAIIVSALARRITDSRVKDAAAVLSKPVRTEELIAAIDAALSASDHSA